MLKISGRIDSINATKVHETITAEISYDEPNLVLDMADVEYMSAAGLRILKALQDNSGQVRIASPSRRVREILQITGLDAVYRVYDSRMQAIHAVQPVTNAHTHLELGSLKAHCPDLAGKPYVDWMLSTESGWNKLGSSRDEVVKEAIEKGVQALIESGTTMIADITMTGLSIEPLLKSGFQGVVYVDYAGTNPSQARLTLNGVQAMIDKHRHHIQRGMHIGIAMRSPYAVHPELWKLGLEYAKSANLPVCIHVAESKAEHEYLLSGTGDLAERYYGDNRPKVPSPKQSPIKYLAEIGALALKPLLIHCVHVDDEDIKLIKENNCAVVHCPRSNLRLQTGRMPLEKFLANDIRVLLGTASLASSPSLDIFDDVEVAVALHHDKVKPDDIIKLASNTIPIDQTVKS